MSPCFPLPSGQTAHTPRLTVTTWSTPARTGKDTKAAMRPGPGREMARSVCGGPPPVKSGARSNRSRRGLRATYAHEIAHLLLDRTTALPLAEVMGGRAVGSTEERAKAFAAQLLLPKEEAGRAFASTTDPARTVRILQSRYRVSQEIIAWQARNSDIQLSTEVHAVLRRFVSRPWRF